MVIVLFCKKYSRVIRFVDASGKFAKPGVTTKLKPVQPEKAELETEFKYGGMTKLLRALQPWNADSLISVTLDGIE